MHLDFTGGKQSRPLKYTDKKGQNARLNKIGRGIYLYGLAKTVMEKT